MAAGPRDPEDGFRWHLLAGTAYGASKRYGEWTARRVARQTTHELYILRLGQVHGGLQSVGRGIVQQLRRYAAVSVPKAPSYVVFVSTIADALVNIANGEEKAGTYSVVESPPWTWKQVWELYVRQADNHCTVTEFPLARRGFSIATVGRFISNFATSKKDLASWHLGRFPQIEAKLKARHFLGIARGEIRNILNQAEYRPINVKDPFVFGKRLQSLRSDREQVEARMIDLRRLIDGLRN